MVETSKPLLWDKTRGAFHYAKPTSQRPSVGILQQNGATFSDQTGPTKRNGREVGQWTGFSNGTANFVRNISTEISGPPPEVISSIPVGGNRNRNINFRNIWHNGKHARYFFWLGCQSITGELEESIVGVPLANFCVFLNGARQCVNTIIFCKNAPFISSIWRKGNEHNSILVHSLLN